MKPNHEHNASSQDLVMYKAKPSLKLQSGKREAAVGKAWTLERRLLLGRGQGTLDLTFRQKIELFKFGKVKAFEHENIDWQREKQAILETSCGSRSWTQEQKIPLIINKRVPGFDGHHINNVNNYPELEGDPRNIRFLTEEEHLKSNQGHRDLGTKTPTKGRLIDRKRTLESFLRIKESNQYKKAQQEARQGQKGGGGGGRQGQERNPDSPPPSPRGPSSKSKPYSKPSSNASEYLRRVSKLNLTESLKRSIPNKSGWQKLTSFQDSVKGSTLKTTVAQFRGGGASGYPAYDKPGGIDLTTKSQHNNLSAPVTARDFGFPFSGRVNCMEVVGGKDGDDQSFIKASLFIDTSSPQKVSVKLPLNISYEELETLKNASTNGDGVIISCILGQEKDIRIETLGNIKETKVEEVLTEADLDLANIAWGKNTYTQDLHVSPVESYVNPYLEELEFADKHQQAFSNFHHILMQPTLYLPLDPKFSVERKRSQGTEYIAKMQTCPLVWTTRGIYYDYLGNTIHDDKFELKLWWEPLLKDIEDKWGAYIQSYPNLARVADYAKAICFLDLCKRSSPRVLPKNPNFTSLQTHTLSNVIDDCPEEMSELQNYHGRQLFKQVLTEPDPWARLSKLNAILGFLETPELKRECSITILDLAMDSNIKAIIDQGKALQRKQILGNVLKYLAYMCLTTDLELKDSLGSGLSDDNRPETCVPLSLLAEAIAILSEIGDLSNVLDAINLLGQMFEFPYVPPLTASSPRPSSKYSNPNWNLIWNEFFSAMSQSQTERAKLEFQKVRTFYECAYMTWNRELLDKLESKCEGKDPKECLLACHQLVQGLEYLPAGLEGEVRAKMLTKSYGRIAQLTQDPILQKTWLIKADYWRKIAQTSKPGQNRSQKSTCNIF